MFRGASRLLLAAAGKKKHTMDDVLNDVMNDAMGARDRGANPDMDYIYKRTQEKVYEAEHGRPPPSKESKYTIHIPEKPRDNLRRLEDDAALAEDPWPLGESSNRIEDPRQNFLDALDELGYWETKYIEYLRENNLMMRRALPMLHEYYRAITHRLLAAEKRFLAARDKVFPVVKAAPSTFAATEAIIQRLHLVYIETHKSLAQSNYDPVRMRSSVTGPIITMSAEQLEDHLRELRNERNLIASVVCE